MTDKQVIIDSVDVSECIFHSLTTIGYAGYNYCKCFKSACECHNDCHYKQLKRKEQECERLKQTLAEIKEIVSGNYEILDPQAKNEILQKISECEVENE